MEFSAKLVAVLSTTILLSIAFAAHAAEDLLAGYGKADSRLKWHAPLAGPTCDFRDGGLRITIPQRQGGYNHWTEAVANAPMLQADAPGGDWDLTAKIDLDDFAKDSGFHVGLMAGFDQNLICTLGPLQGPCSGVTGDWPELWLETTGMPVCGKAKIDLKGAQIKLSKRDTAYTGYYRQSGADEWIKIGDYMAGYAPEFVGIVGKTFRDGPGTAFTVRQLSLERADPKAASASISVDAAKRVGKIDRNIYGHFIEHLDRCIQGGIWAEMLWNRKFTGGVNEQGVIESWNAFGDGATYSRDNIEFYTSSQSQRIELAPGKDAGIQKTDAHIGVKPQKYIARAVIKQRGMTGGVTISLRQGDKVYASAVIPAGKDWAQHAVTLDCTASDPNAQFSLSATGPGTLWVGCVSLMPIDNLYGARADVLAAIKATKPPLIRWPGGNMVSGYHWEDAIGPMDRRMPRWERAWNTWEWNDFGTDEYISFCRAVGTEPYICVNTGEGQADEAAHWVEYCNGSVNTPYGKLRASNGHPEPYNVKIWGIGNEMWGDWQLGHLDATKYALKSIEFARAMKRVDSTIKLVGVGVDRDGWGNWNSTVSKIAGSYYDWLSVHNYKSSSPKDCKEYTYLNLTGGALEVENMLSDTAKVVDTAAGRELPLAFDEWNIWFPNGNVGSEYQLRDGLYAAGVFHAMHRLSDHVTMANLAQLVNVLGAIQTNSTQVVETPICKVFELYSNLCQDNRCEIKCDSPGLDTPAGRMSILDASATVSDNGKTLALAVINRDPVRDIPANLNLSGITPKSEASVAVLNGPDAYSINTFASPDAVKITRSKAELDLSKPYVFPAHSVTVITVESP